MSVVKQLSSDILGFLPDLVRCPVLIFRPDFSPVFNNLNISLRGYRSVIIVASYFHQLLLFLFSCLVFLVYQCDIIPNWFDNVLSSRAEVPSATSKNQAWFTGRSWGVNWMFCNIYLQQLRSNLWHNHALMRSKWVPFTKEFLPHIANWRTIKTFS